MSDILDQAIRKWSFLMSEEEKKAAIEVVGKVNELLMSKGCYPANIRVCQAYLNIYCGMAEEMFAPVDKETENEVKEY